MTDETIRRDRERSQSINRSEDFLQSRFLASLDRNDDIFTSMASLNLSAAADDRLSNLASMLQFKQSESQSQTVFDDNNIISQSHIGARSLESNINDSDVKSDLKDHIQDSDNERSIRRSRLTTSDDDTQQPTPSQFKTARKFRHRDAERRFTLDCQNEDVKDVETTETFRIINWIIDSPVTLRLKSIQEFIRNVAERLEDWWNEIHELETIASTMSERLAEHEFTIGQLQTSHIAQVDKVKDVVSQYNFVQRQLMDAQTRLITIEDESRLKVNKQKQKTSRLRQLRDEHRQRGDKYAEELRSLRADKEVLEKKIRGLKAKQSDSIVPQDSESDENANYRERRQNPFSTYDRPQSFERARLSELNRPFELLTRHPLRDNNIEDRSRIATFEESSDLEINDHRILPYEKIEDIKDYYGDHAEWKSWKDEVLIKFWTSARQYSIEQHKINYVRKHLKSVAYDAVVYRAQMNSVYLYNTFDEMLKDLEQVFEKRDEVLKKTSELFSNNFFMSFKNKNEIFNEFMIRFNSLAVPLRVDDNIKINELKKKITSTMRYRMRYFKNVKIWHEFVEHCRDVYEDIEEVNQYKIDKTSTFISKTIRVSRFSRIKDSKFDQQQDSTEFRRSRNRTDDRATRLSTHIVERLRKEKRCFRCFKKGHSFRDKDASCKDQDVATEDQLSAALAAVGIEWNEVEAEDWNDVTDDEVSSLSSADEFQAGN